MDEYHMNPQAMLDKIQHLRQLKAHLDARNLGPVKEEVGALSGTDFGTAVESLCGQRISIYCTAIEQQALLQEAGIQRIQTLREIFSFYSHYILGGRKEPVMIELMQQETDLAIAYSLSDSFLRYAERLSGSVSTDALQEAKRTVESQYRLYKSFSATSVTEDSKAQQSADTVHRYSPEEIVRLKDRFEFHTLDVANANMRLSNTNLDLFQNIASSLYVWLKNLQNGVGNSSLGAALFPTRDLDYEAEILSLALERVEVYARRAGCFYDLVDKIVETDRADGLQVPAIS